MLSSSGNAVSIPATAGGSTSSGTSSTVLGGKLPSERCCLRCLERTCMNLLIASRNAGRMRAEKLSELQDTELSAVMRGRVAQMEANLKFIRRHRNVIWPRVIWQLDNSSSGGSFNRRLDNNNSCFCATERLYSSRNVVGSDNDDDGMLKKTSVVISNRCLLHNNTNIIESTPPSSMTRGCISGQQALPSLEVVDPLMTEAMRSAFSSHPTLLNMGGTSTPSTSVYSGNETPSTTGETTVSTTMRVSSHHGKNHQQLGGDVTPLKQVQLMTTERLGRDGMIETSSPPIMERKRTIGLTFPTDIMYTREDFLMECRLNNIGNFMTQTSPLHCVPRQALTMLTRSLSVLDTSKLRDDQKRKQDNLKSMLLRRKSTNENMLRAIDDTIFMEDTPNSNFPESGDSQQTNNNVKNNTFIRSASIAMYPDGSLTSRASPVSSLYGSSDAMLSPERVPNAVGVMAFSATRVAAFDSRVTSRAQDIARFRSQKHHSFAPFSITSNSMSSLLSTDGWPFSVTAKLTNYQTVDARLRMLRHFTNMVKDTRVERGAGTWAFLPRPARTRLSLKAGAWSIPRPGKKNKHGEDSYFIEGVASTTCFLSQDIPGGYSFAGVADGVGEWSEYGCSPRAFAEAIMIGARDAAVNLRYYWSEDSPPSSNILNSRNPAYSKAGLRALHVLREGFSHALNQDACFGSATALVAGLDERGDKLGVANLGDSSLIVLRRASSNPLSRSMTIIRRTKEQQHFFNCPYQLSRIPTKDEIPLLEARGMKALVGVLSKASGPVQTDTPEMAGLYDIDVQEGDLIIMGSDGLFDNLFDVEIVHLASLCLSPYDAHCASRMLVSGENSSNNNECVVGPSCTSAKDSCSSCLSPSSLGTSCGYMHDEPGTSCLSPASEVTESSDLSDYYRKLDTRRLTAAWLGSDFAHPLVQAPPVHDPEYGIATPPQMLARAIAEAAFFRSLDPRAKTPFARQARQAGCHMLSCGGKLDDITVVAAWVTSDHHNDLMCCSAMNEEVIDSGPLLPSGSSLHVSSNVLSLS